MKQRKNTTDRFFAKYFNNEIFSDDFIESIDTNIYNMISLKLSQHEHIEHSIDFNQYCYMLYNKIKNDIKK